MLRTLQPSEPELIRLCRSRTWDGVSHRSQTHPLEASPTHHAKLGEGSTALSVAVGSRAPLEVIRNLVQADASQVGVSHVVRGNVLHEALRNRVESSVLELLLQAVIELEHKNSRNNKHVSRSLHLLGNLDDLGRTPLHYMVDRVIRTNERGEYSEMDWVNLHRMIQAYPHAVEIIDADGTTPLVQLLLIPPYLPECEEQHPMERDIHNAIKHMLAVCPTASRVSRRLPRPWHYHFCSESDTTSILHGDGVPNPLSCALLHGRSPSIVELLLDTNRTKGDYATRALVTHYHEVPLHVATSMRSSHELLQKLVQEDKAVLQIEDVHGLTPLDWMWIRHTLDWCSSFDPFAPVRVSRRRYIHNHFLDWYGRVSNQYFGLDKSMVDSPNPGVREMCRKLRQDLFRRISVLLPAIASTMTASEHVSMEEDTDVSLPLVHAAACVPCPLAMLRLACDTLPEQLWTRDQPNGRLPIHHAAARGGYKAMYPIGVSCHLHNLEEVPPLKMLLSICPGSSRVTDDRMQLPLHIAIDHVKRNEPSSNDESTSTSKQQRSYEGIAALLQVYPNALHRRDGVTMLYPFQQAAQGPDGDVELTFMLLLRDPSLLRSLVTE
eukprot:Nitzschia sp. Nitz4//scaffold15_size197535//17616//19436//NITZ4_001552-RA/size197535-processed-gene-0.3-mRNA-1//1//CDS//3329537637//1697//frame0